MKRILEIKQVLPNGTTRHEELTLGDGDKLLMQYPESMTMDEVVTIWKRVAQVFEHDGVGAIAVPDTISFHVLHIGDEE
jgi:hypothetical protein